MANTNMELDIKEVLYSEEYIQKMVDRIGAEITKDYADKKLLLVSVLKGSVMFMADLMRAIKIPARIDFMSVSSYGSGTKSSGTSVCARRLVSGFCGTFVWPSFRSSYNQSQKGISRSAAG